VQAGVLRVAAFLDHVLRRETGRPNLNQRLLLRLIVLAKVSAKAALSFMYVHHDENSFRGLSVEHSPCRYRQLAAD
jgi:hypothetical protein